MHITVLLKLKEKNTNKLLKYRSKLEQLPVDVRNNLVHEL